MTREQLAAIRAKKDADGKKPTIHGVIRSTDDTITLTFPRSYTLEDLRSNSSGNPMLCVHFMGPQDIEVVDGAERDGNEVSVPMTFRGAILNLNLA